MTTILRTAACLAAIALAGCGALDPYNLLSRQALPDEPTTDTPVPPPARPGLGPAQREAALDFVWTTVNERYYDPGFNGVDWRAARERWRASALAAETDEKFWDALDHMAGELRDAHTRVESPARAQRIARFESVGLGFGLRPLEGMLAVTGVDRQSDAYWAGVRPGMTLEEIAGEPARAAFARALGQARASSTERARHRTAVRRMLEGEPGTSASLTFRRGDGSTFTASLERRRAVNRPRVEHRALPSGMGYIRLTAWEQSLEGEMIRAVEALGKAPGLVIDLRGNTGGSALMVRNVASQFFGKGDKVLFGRALTRTGKPVTLAFDWIEVIKLEQRLEGTGAYPGPVVVLVNDASASGSELFAGLLKSQGRATLVGRTTCGCLLAYLGYTGVPGGGRLAYSEVGFALPDGRRIEGEGVAPDVPVPLSIADLLVDRDRALEQAQASLRSRVTVQAAARPESRPVR